MLTNAQKTAEYFGLPYFDLTNYDIASCPSALLQCALVQKGVGLPLYVSDETLCVATTDPSSPLLSELAFVTGKQPSIVVVESDQLATILRKVAHNNLYYVTQPIAGYDNNDGISQDDDAPVVRFINNILIDALKKGASDIHFEPYEQHYRIRFRIDGLLVDSAEPPKQFANHLTSRLKIMANLDIAERRLPQDGRITLHLNNTLPTDCRVNTCPTLQGEKIVLRLLESNRNILNIDHLGLEVEQKTQLVKTLRRANGLILVTGPTGSGKTVTLYTALSIVNTIEKNISTVEDPVEIQIPGINQVHINPKTGLGFPEALRALLRQDPDIIMVGEIRDLETAQIAVKASQTGHLVLSTLHTNSGPETLVRLNNMGLPAYNIASSIALIIAQRLVRKLCEHCKHPQKIPTTTLQEEGFLPHEIATLQIYSPGENYCQHCTGGYRGRIGIYETMPISTAMTDLIMNHGNSIAIARQATKEGIINLRQAGLQKVRNGITSLAELNRVL